MCQWIPVRFKACRIFRCSAAFMYCILWRRSWLFYLHGSIKVDYKGSVRRIWSQILWVNYFVTDLRDRFFDETSCWCLPSEILKFTEEQLLQPNSTGTTALIWNLRKPINIFSDYCIAVSKRVLTRLCLYWLPRYLLHLRMKDLSKDPDFADEKFNSEMEKIRIDFQIFIVGCNFPTQGNENQSE